MQSDYYRWALYSSQRRGEKYHLFRNEERRSVCSFADRRSPKATEVEQRDGQRTCQQCGAFARREGIV